MLDIKFIRENAEAVKKNCEARNIKCDVDRLLELYEKKIMQAKYVEELNAEKNVLNDLIQNRADRRHGGTQDDGNQNHRKH